MAPVKVNDPILFLYNNWDNPAVFGDCPTEISFDWKTEGGKRILFLTFSLEGAGPTLNFKFPGMEQGVA